MVHDDENGLDSTQAARHRGSDSSSKPASVPLAEPAPDGSSSLPETIGDYRIAGVLGQGGMGVVYIGEQSEPVRRRAAVKLIRANLRSRAAVRRFEAERHAMARLSHPNVAQLYEAGSTAKGQLYFAMELVEGSRITDYCDRYHLGLDARLALFGAVCDGVQHAHQKGILHRDLKPSNVLVGELDGAAVPKVIDFGIAKAIDEPLVDGTQLTGESPIGTPAYLPPEAVIATDDGGFDIDTRGDVYSLGILLYELLLGARPWARRLSFAQTIQQISSSDDAPKLSRRWSGLDIGTRTRIAECRGLTAAALQRQLGGDLDWIVAKAIAKDRDRRYGSVSELGEDISRYLRHEPVLACAPSLAYRTGKLIRRHRVATVAAVIAVLALITGIVGLGLGLNRAQREADTAKQTVELLQEFLSSVDPGEKGKDLTVLELVEAFKPRLEQLDDKPEIQASLLATYGLTYRRLGLLAEASSMLERAYELRKTSLGAEHPDTLVSLNSFANSLRSLGKFEDAEVLYRQCWEASTRVHGKDHSATLSVLHNIAIVLQSQGKLAEAEEVTLRVLEQKKRIRGPDHPSTLSTMSNLAALMRSQGRFEEAEQLTRHCLKTSTRVLGEEHPRTLRSLSILGQILVSQDKPSEAEPVLRRCLEVQRRVLGPEHPDTLYSLTFLADSLGEQGKLAGAEAIYREAAAGRARVLGEDHPLTLSSMNNWAESLIDLGDYQQAELTHREAMERRRQVLGPRHTHTVLSMSNLARALVLRDRLSDGLHQTGEILGLREEVQLDAYTANALFLLGRVLEAKGMSQEAVECFRWAAESGHEDAQAALARSGE